MKASIRKRNNTLILDLYGDWPQSENDLRRLREEMNNALTGHAGPLICHLHDVTSITSLQLGVLIAGMKNVSHAADEFIKCKIVSQSSRIREMFNTCDSRIRAYETEEEALRKATPLEKLVSALVSLPLIVVAGLAAVLVTIWLRISRLRRLLHR